jgi:hypothetical protein
MLCGNIFNRNIYAIKKNKFKNCGCQNLQYDLRNKRFGKLVALKPLGLDKHKEMLWECKCDCGKTYKAKSYSLRTGKTTQCRKCSMEQIGDKNRKYITFSKRLHECYTNMKTRCKNKKQDKTNRYINRGITLCEEWDKSYECFQEWALNNGYKENLTIDRIDNDKGYSPNNCRWVTRTEQANNRRTSYYLYYNGEKDTLANWSRRLGIPYYYIQYRVYKNKKFEDIVNEFNNGTRRTRKKELSQ